MLLANAETEQNTPPEFSPGGEGAGVLIHRPLPRVPTPTPSVTGPGLLPQWVCSPALPVHPGAGPSGEGPVAGSHGVIVPRSAMRIWVGTDVLGKTINRISKSQGMFEGAPVGEK